MSTFAIGDIHGQLAPLLDLFEQLRDEVTRADAVVFLGDYIDRGPDSRRVIDAILSFRCECTAHVVCLRGNHEDWLLRTQADYSRHSWLLGMEAFDTIRSYSIHAEQVLRDAIANAGLEFYLEPSRLPYDVFFDAVPAAHRAFFAALALFFESPDCICAHGGLHPLVPRLADQSPESFLWGDEAFPLAYSGNLPVVYGHWNNAELDPAGWPRPRFVGNTIGIDSISHGVLTAIQMPQRRIFQSARYSQVPSIG